VFPTLPAAMTKECRYGRSDIDAGSSGQSLFYGSIDTLLPV
jgi:hypothetical protein